MLVIAGTVVQKLWIHFVPDSEFVVLVQFVVVLVEKELGDGSEECDEEGIETGMKEEVK